MAYAVASETANAPMMQASSRATANRAPGVGEVRGGLRPGEGRGREAHHGGGADHDDNDDELRHQGESVEDEQVDHRERAPEPAESLQDQAGMPHPRDGAARSVLILADRPRRGLMSSWLMVPSAPWMSPTWASSRTALQRSTVMSVVNENSLLPPRGRDGPGRGRLPASLSAHAGIPRSGIGGMTSETRRGR